MYYTLVRSPCRSAFWILAATLLSSATTWAGVIETTSTVCTSSSNCVSSDTGFAGLFFGDGSQLSYAVGNAILYPNDPTGDQLRLHTEAIASLQNIAPGNYDGPVVDSSVSIHDTLTLTGWTAPEWVVIHPWINIRLVGTRGLDAAPESPISDSRFANVQFGSDSRSGCISEPCNLLDTVTFDFSFPVVFDTPYAFAIETHTNLFAYDATVPAPYSLYTAATSNWTLESISVSYDEQRQQQMSGLTLHAGYAYPFASGTVEIDAPEPGAWTLALAAVPVFWLLRGKQRPR